MLDFIKKSIAAQTETFNTPTSIDENLDDTILEYAGEIPELNDLSQDGRQMLERPIIDIPLDDDVELESLEINITDGRVTDIPSTANIQESYTGMKTFDYFIQEAYNSTPRFERESQDNYENRVYSSAEHKYGEYKDYLIQEGLFGFNKISLDDPVVPATAIINFGPLTPSKLGQNYYVKLKVLFEIDSARKILKKQLEGFNIAVDKDIFTVFGEILADKLEQSVEGKTADDVWSIFTPKAVIIPIKPVDSFVVAVAFKSDVPINGTYEHCLSWTHTIKSSSKGLKDDTSSVTISPTDMKFISNPEANFSISNMVCKDDVIKESHVANHPNRFIQEAIDFGTEGGEEAPPESDAPAVAEAPTVENNTEPTTDAGAEPEFGTEAGVKEDKTQVDNNNVSDQIADKVAEIDNGDTNVEEPSIEGEVDEPEMPTDTDEKGIDDQLGELDNMGNTESSLDEKNVGEIDVDNMTIDQLLEQGTEKLKGMTIQQLKQFMAADDTLADMPAEGDGSETNDDETLTEAFILTPSNINKEIDIALRKALGILNDDSIRIPQLVTDFKKAGKKLNKILGKAGKMKKVYNEDEISSINKLNSITATLLTTLRSNGGDETYESTIRRLIKAFTEEATAVASIVEKKNGGKK